MDGTDRALDFSQDGTTLTVTMSGENPEPNLRPVIKVTFDGTPTYIPTQTVTAVDGATISSEQFFGRASAMRYSGAQVYDAYLVNKGDKAITGLTLKFSGNFDASTTYKITLGTTSIEVTGAQIEAGEVGEGLTLEPGQVTPLRLELAHPAYYADPIRLGSVSATVHVYGENAATQPPVIATDPASVSVKAGESATFTVVASGRPTATIQWYRVPKGATEGTAIPDATSAMYTLTTTLEDDGAQFYAVATNANGSTTSARATLTVTKGSDNLALNKTATMSSTGWGGTASRAVDGNTDGVWDNGSVAHTGKQANPWWEVDLGEEHPLGVVNVWNRSSSDNCQGISCDQRLHDFWVVASTTRLDASFNPATAGAVDGVHAIKVDGVGGRPSAVDFEGFDARFIRVIQPTEFGEFALAEVEAFAAAAPTPDPDEQEPPVIKPLKVTANPAEDAQISGDGAFRTVTGKEGTQVTIKAEATGTPTPTLFWQIKREGSDSWSIVEDENGPELTLTIDGESNGSVVRVMAMNEAGVTESGLVTLALAEEPAPTPDPTPDPAPTPDHTVGTWMNDGIGWWWKITGGDYAKNETLTLDGRVYRFDQNGYMLTGWVYWDGAWRYHNGAGAQVTGWVNLGGSWYYLDPSGSMHTGWLQMGSNWYYFDASGRMVTGWQQIGGVWYYFGTGGDMYTGGHWIGWRWYTFSSGGQWLG